MLSRAEAEAMATNRHTPDLLATMNASTGADRYARRQREIRRGKTTLEGALPLEYDENGFPIPQRRTTLVRRVGRLLRG